MNDLVDSSKSFTHNFIYDGQEIIVELDGNNQILARYTQSGLRTDDTLAVDVTSQGQSANVAQNAQSYYYLKDALGSVTDITDSSGNLVQHYNYTSFGTIQNIKDGAGADITTSPIVNTAYTYTNRELDSETGNYYYRARYYDPQIGRFLQEDPHPGKITLPSSVINRFNYVNNNSINLVDPSGKFFIAALFALGTLTLTSGSIIGSIAAVGATLLGSMVVSGIYSAITGKWDQFWQNTEIIFNISAAFLGLAALGGHFFGGGIQEVGANSWYQGMVASRTNILGFAGGDLTIGTSAYFGGTYPSLLSHSLGHTIQFIVLAGAFGPKVGGAAYLGLGLLGTTSLGAWWESGADILGDFF
ncbi:MAG: RHS repeat-associated core domain-containing protein [Oligoflexia bacterium]|nr:RHS repeat-associated core domain-containing protein [Oligoflexia bacterium]